MAEDFAIAAGRFCSVIEQVDRLSRRRWFAEVEAALSVVYASAVALPSVGAAIPVSGSPMSTDERSELYAALRSKTGADDAYWHVFDPGEQAAVARGSLADDLVEIYRSLRAGLEAMRSGRAPDDVMFEWRASFDTQWATHAIAAMNALRAALKDL